MTDMEPNFQTGFSEGCRLAGCGEPVLRKAVELQYARPVEQTHANSGRAGAVDTEHRAGDPCGDVGTTRSRVDFFMNNSEIWGSSSTTAT